MLLCGGLTAVVHRVGGAIKRRRRDQICEHINHATTTATRTSSARLTYQPRAAPRPYIKTAMVPVAVRREHLRTPASLGTRASSPTLRSRSPGTSNNFVGSASSDACSTSAKRESACGRAARSQLVQDRRLKPADVAPASSRKRGPSAIPG